VKYFKMVADQAAGGALMMCGAGIATNIAEGRSTIKRSAAHGNTESQSSVRVVADPPPLLNSLRHHRCSGQWQWIYGGEVFQNVC
jgi:hypothetical protein